MKISDRTFFISFVLSLIFLAFLGGSIATHYQWVLSNPITNAAESAEAWWQLFREQEPEDNGSDNTLAQGKIRWDKEHAYPGYTLVSLRSSTSVYLLDMKGRSIHRWDMPFRKAWPRPPHIPFPKGEKQIYIERAFVFPNGDLLAIFIGPQDTPYGYGMVKMDKNSNVLWTYDQRVHHDFYIDEGTGNIYALIQDMVKKPLPGLNDLHYPFLNDSIVILSPQGKETHRVSIAEAFRDSPFALMLYHAPKNPSRWDPFHTNSVMKLEPSLDGAFPMFKAGQVLISIRNMNTVAVIDMELHKVVWAYNGLWRAQHSAKFLPNGHILLLDNKGHVVKGKPRSRLIEFDPATLQVAWSYVGNAKQPFYSRGYGRTQRLPNGNTLAIDAMHSHIFEIMADGTIVWSYKIPHDIPQPKNPSKNKINCVDICPEEQSDWFRNIPNVVVDATRYAESELPFLKENLH